MWNILTIRYKKFQNIVVVFLDFKQAFETINQEILFQILKSYGICGSAMQWLTDYLTDRKEKVKLSDIIYTVRNINYGIPQGSILGTLLFILYINNISNANVYDNKFNMAVNKMNT